MRTLFLYCLGLVLFGCGAPASSGTVSSLPALVPPHGVDTAAAYRMAIGDHIRILRRRDGTFPDTLFIGKHMDFPHIELPDIIDRITVRVMDPALAETLARDPGFAYLNVFAWFTADRAEFQLVRFEQGMRHDPAGRDDLHLNYRIDGVNGSLSLDSLKK